MDNPHGYTSQKGYLFDPKKHPESKEITDAVRKGNYAVDTSKEELETMFPGKNYHKRMGIEKLSDSAQEQIRSENGSDIVSKNSLLGGVMKVFGEKSGISDRFRAANLFLGEEPLPQSKAWELGDGSPTAFYDKQKSEILDNLGFHINLRNRAELGMTERSSLIKTQFDIMESIPDDDGLINTPEERKVYKETQKLMRKQKKQRDEKKVSEEHITNIFKNANPDYLESFLTMAARGDIPKDLTGDAIKNMTMKEQYVRGKPLNVYSDEIFKAYVGSKRSQEDKSSGNVFAGISDWREGEIFAAESSMESDSPHRIPYLKMHEAAHLTGDMIPGGEYLPGQHDAVPEEQRADYNVLSELIEGGAIQPTHSNMWAAIRGTKANWQKRANPVKQVTGPFKGDDPAKFFYENEFAGWKDNFGNYSSKIAGEDVKEYGLTKFYNKLDDMSNMTKEERATVLKEYGLSDKKTKSWEEYYWGEQGRLPANKSFYKNVIQKLYDEYNTKEPK